MEILEFYADWCGPCKAMSLVIDEIQKEFPNINITKIDVDKNPDKAKEYNIMSIPAFIFLKGDKEIKRIVGSVDKLTFINSLR